MKSTYKKTTILIAMMLLFSISGLAAWQIKLKSATATGMVVSNEDGVMVFEQNVVNFNEINTDNHSYTETINTIIRNKNGDLNFTFNVTETRSDDTTDTCTDYENDITFTYELNGAEIINGQEVTIPSGYNDLNITVDAVMSSCPGNVTVQYELN